MGDRVRIANASGYWGDDPEASLRADHQGKTLAQGLLTLDVPEAVLAATPPDGEG